MASSATKTKPGKEEELVVVQCTGATRVHSKFSTGRPITVRTTTGGLAHWARGYLHG